MAACIIALALLPHVLENFWRRPSKKVSRERRDIQHMLAQADALLRACSFASLAPCCITGTRMPCRNMQLARGAWSFHLKVPGLLAGCATSLSNSLHIAFCAQIPLYYATDAGREQHHRPIREDAPKHWWRCDNAPRRSLGTRTWVFSKKDDQVFVLC
jgi:hypothetical protein